MASTIGVAAISNSAVAFIYQVALARNLTADEFGIFSSSLALVATMATLAGFGLNHFWIKSFAESSEEAKKLLFGGYLIVCGASTICIIGMAAFSSEAAYLAHNRSVAILLSFSVASQCFAELLIARYQVEKREGLVALSIMLQNTIKIIFLSLLLIIEHNPTIIQISIAHALSSLLIMIISARGLRSFYGPGRWCEIPRGIGRQLRALKLALKGAAPFGAAALFQILYYQSDLVMLPMLSTAREAGTYGAAFVLISATYVVPNAIIQRFLITRVHHWALRERVTLKQFWKLGTACFGIAGAFFATLLISLSSTLIEIALGVEYLASTRTLEVLAISLPIIFASYVSGAIITTRNSMHKKTKILAFVSFANVAANMVVIPQFGAVGAAWTTVGSSLLILTLYGFTASKILEQENSMT